MAYYSYNNPKVTINGDTVFANKADISMNTDLSPSFLAGDRSSFSNVAAGGSQGSMSVSYYLTGSDPLKKYITDEKNTITGDFAGLSFVSGYLTSLSFNAQPFSPVLVDAKIDFYGNLKGKFNPSTEQIPSNKILIFSDAKINESGIGKEKIKNMSYSFSSMIQPMYAVGAIVPSEVRFQRKYSNLELLTYGVSGELDYQGQQTSVNVQLNNLTGLAEQYSVEGPLLSRRTTSQAGEKVNSTLSITQNFIDEKPVLTSITTTGNAMALGGEGFELHGSNLTNTTSMEVGDRAISNFTVFSDSKVSGVLALDTMPGSHKVRLTTYGGTDNSKTITVGDSGL